MHTPRFSVLALAAGLLACAGEQRSEPEPPIPAGQGRLCVLGELDELQIQTSDQMERIREVEVTGARTCVNATPGPTTLHLGHTDIWQAQTWVDAGETTSLALAEAPELEVRASASRTEALARALLPSRCLSHAKPCRLRDEERSELEAATDSPEIRERQAARLVLLSFHEQLAMSEDEQLALAEAFWSERQAAPEVTPAMLHAAVFAASMLSDEALRELEDAAIEGRGLAQGWPPFFRGLTLLLLLEQAGPAPESDGLRTRIRAALRSDPLLREGPVTRFLNHELGPLDEELIRAEALTRTVLEPFAGPSCEPGARWLIYLYSTSCKGCRRAKRELLAMLEAEAEATPRVLALSPGTEDAELTARPEIEGAQIGDALRQWFTDVRRGTIFPYFMGLSCGEDQVLHLVGVGGLADATSWDARVAPTLGDAPHPPSALQQ